MDGGSERLARHLLLSGILLRLGRVVVLVVTIAIFIAAIAMFVL